ncbi:YqzE family protein [Paenibacillus hodogayensis]|uniref:YqzE family protein n=1 Tax=Paenibacillus hodogayensis TaxID=279208 RepID=A0ABV5VXX4_9BACL
MAIKTEDYIKYLTEKVVAYMDLPPEVRKEQRSLHRSVRDPWHVRWFGLVPLSVAMWWRQRKRKKEHPSP